MSPLCLGFSLVSFITFYSQITKIYEGKHGINVLIVFKRQNFNHEKDFFAFLYLLPKKLGSFSKSLCDIVKSTWPTFSSDKDLFISCFLKCSFFLNGNISLLEKDPEANDIQ